MMKNFRTRSKFDVMESQPGEIDESKVLHHRLWQTVGFRALKRFVEMSQCDIWPDRTSIIGAPMHDKHMEGMVDKQLWSDFDTENRERKRLVRPPR